MLDKATLKQGRRVLQAGVSPRPRQVGRAGYLVSGVVEVFRESYHVTGGAQLVSGPG